MNPVESGCGRRRQKDWSLICQLSSKHGLLRRSAERQRFFRPLRCFSFWARKRKHIFARVIFSRGRLSLSMGQLCACAAASCPTGFKTVGSKASCALRPCLGKRSPLVVSICPSAWLRLQDTNNPTRHLPISRPCPSQVGAHGAQMLPRRAAEERQQQMKCHVVDQPGRGDPAPKVGHPTNRQMPIQDPGRAPADWRIDALRHAPASPAATPHSRRLLLQRRQLQWWRLLELFPLSAPHVPAARFQLRAASADRSPGCPPGLRRCLCLPPLMPLPGLPSATQTRLLHCDTSWGV